MIAHNAPSPCAIVQTGVGLLRTASTDLVAASMRMSFQGGQAQANTAFAATSMLAAQRCKATAPGEEDRVDDLVDGGVDPQHGRVAEDPHASCTHVHILRRYAESDRAYDLQGSRIDPQEGAVVAIADPDRTFPDCRPGWSPTDGNLADNRVRFRVDDSD